MSATSVARALGGSESSSGWHRAPCPVHHGRGEALGLRDGDRGLVAICHAGCSRDAILAELRRRGIVLEDGGPAPTPDPEAVERRRAADTARRAARIANASDIWDQADPAAGSVVETYLWGRLCMMPVPPAIRLARGMRHRESGERRPAMLCRVDHAEHGFVGVHTTYLAPDGSGKASLDPVRKSFGAIGGGAVRLGPVRPDTWLVIGEGVETTLSVMQATGLPGWAALSAIGVECRIMPAEATMALIVADHDINGAGQLAAARAAARFRREGRRVRVVIPPKPGSDWNDVMRGRAPARMIEGLRHAAA